MKQKVLMNLKKKTFTTIIAQNEMHYCFQH
jgi:hypothetical protein